MESWAKLYSRLTISTTAPWVDSIGFFDSNEEPLAITGPVRIALRAKGKEEGYDFVAEQSEIVVAGHVATWTIPASRLQALCPGNYTLEITTGDDLARKVRIRGDVTVSGGIVP